MTKDEKDGGYITENTGRRGVDWGINTLFPGDADPSIWLDSGLSLVAELKTMRKGEAVLTKRLQLHFHEYGEGSSLCVWNGTNTIGYLDGQDLKEFLLRALMRTQQTEPFDSALREKEKARALTAAPVPVCEQEGVEEGTDGNHNFVA
jgi:hypothetical protein